MKIIIWLGIFLFPFVSLIAQATGEITGKVVDKISKERLPGVNVVVLGTGKGDATDKNGEFVIEKIPTGSYQVKASFVGYEPVVKTDVIVNSAKPTSLTFELLESAVELEDVNVTADYFDKDQTEITSVKNFSYEEIRRAPGGNEDVIRALSVFPGVARQSAGRNDLIVRGGAPSENLYLVDGFKFPTVNHFGSQGATGGPLSFIDLDFVENTTFSTGGFSALYGDKLSSVLRIDLREARKDHFGGKSTISATQFGQNFEGPIGEKGDFIFSIRRSYLDFIFDAAGFNFVPEYYDLTTKATYDFDNRNKLTFLFIGAYDRVNFNNENQEDIYDNSRILANNQNQYVNGYKYRHLFEDGFVDIKFRRSYIKYDSFQKDTNQVPVFLNKSIESENQLETELVLKTSKSGQLDLGISGNLVNFESDIKFPRNFVTTYGDTLPINSVDVNRYFTKAFTFAQYSNLVFDRLRYNFGVRLDYFDGIDEKFYFSPRFSTSYTLTSDLTVNFSTGIYYQSPSYIWLAAGDLNSNLKETRVDQYIAGVNYKLKKDTRLKVEAFYKDYSDYPTSKLREYLVLANTGAGFGGAEDNFASYGLEPLVSQGEGVVRGLEFSIQKKLSDIPLYGILSLTYSRAEFTALDGIERVGNFDQRWIFSLSGGYKFSHEWEASMRFRYASGTPYTPYNSDGTQSVSQYNTARFEPSHSLDIRVDKRWNFEGWSLISYIDIQNIYNKKNVSGVRWDYFEQKVDFNETIGILPSIGLSVEF